MPVRAGGFNGDVCAEFSVTDLFMAGVGFDISGATLLAIGLFKSPSGLAADVLMKGVAQVINAGRDFIDGTFGLVSLIFGFLLQAVGYALLLGREMNDPIGRSAALTGTLFLVAAGAFTLLAWLAARERLLKRYLVRVARYDNAGNPRDFPDLLELTHFAQGLGEERRPDEYEMDDGEQVGAMRYVSRVFGVNRFNIR